MELTKDRFPYTQQAFSPSQRRVQLHFLESIFGIACFKLSWHKEGNGTKFRHVHRSIKADLSYIGKSYK